MASEHSADPLLLQGFVTHPREDLNVEYKVWLNLSDEKSKATLAKAAIALANHGGGYVIIGFDDQGKELVSIPRPENVPEITQDSINSAIRRYSEPEFHCRLYYEARPETLARHPIVRVPGGHTPIMCKRDQFEAKVLQNKVYVRKPGPRSEEPHTEVEWRSLLDRCVLARGEDLLESIRFIVSGVVKPQNLTIDSQESAATPGVQLAEYCDAARMRWTELTSSLPDDSPARFPKGYYEMGFALIGANPAGSHIELKTRLDVARKRDISGWPPFLDIGITGWNPYIYDDESMEAWLGRENKYRPPLDSYECDFWRASLNGELYTIRGYSEDSKSAAGRDNKISESIWIDLPIVRIAEGILFAYRLADQFDGVEQLAIACRFTGLNGRSLVRSISRTYLTVPNSISRTTERALSGQATLKQVRDNLPEVIFGIVKPLYEIFDFYQVSIGEVRRILSDFTRV